MSISRARVAPLTVTVLTSHWALRMHSTCLMLLLQQFFVCLLRLKCRLASLCSTTYISFIHSSIHSCFLMSCHIMIFSASHKSVKGLWVTPRCDNGIRLAVIKGPVQRSEVKGRRTVVQRSHLGRPTPLTPSMVPEHVGWYHGPSTNGMFIVLRNYQVRRVLACI